MRLTDRQLIGLPVYTQSAEHLGVVSRLILETETGELAQLEIASSNLAKIFSKTLLVNKSQIISITAEKVVVEDNVRKSLTVKEMKEKKLSSEVATPALSRDRL